MLTVGSPLKFGSLKPYMMRNRRVRIARSALSKVSTPSS